MTGYVYAIECNGRVKIGYSAQPEKRFSKVASDAPFPCVLLGYWPGDVSDELAVHGRFNPIRVHGEWFAATQELLAFIADNVVPMENKAIRPDDSPLTMWRKKQRMTQADFAERMSVSPKTVIRWESGEPRIPVKRLQDAADVLGVHRHLLRPDLYAGMKMENAQ
jgi:DNA-binding XRE family transcriptional regulator